MSSRLRYLVLLTLSAALSGCTDSDAKMSATSLPFNAAQAPTVEFALPDMMCEDGCAQAVEEILESQPGVEDVLVDFEGKSATVAVEEGKFDADQAIAALVDKGFDNSALAADDAQTEENAAAKSELKPDSRPAAQ